MRHFARDFRHGVIVIAEADVDRHAEAVGQGLRAIDPRRVCEIEVEVGRRVVVEVITDQKDQVQRRPQRIRGVAGGIRRSDVLRIDSVSSGLPSGPR